MTIPNLIRARRIDMKMTQKSIGDQCGYKGSTAQALVAQWEAGTKSIPRNKLRRLSWILHLDVQDLIPEEKQT